MAKGKTATVFFCQNCGYESTKWLGQCPGCREWNTFVEETIDKTELKNTGNGAKRDRREASEPCVLSEIAIREENKTLTGIKELDRVLGGGIVQGSLTLVGGDPGIGKSTLLLQVCHNLSTAGHKVLYISGEESKVQIKMRADRIAGQNPVNDRMVILSETSLEAIFDHIKEEKPEIVVIDSIQTIATEQAESSPGSVSQVRECASALLRFAKSSGVPVILIGHINKEGTLAGPKILEHIVDTVLQFEGDQHHLYRILRSIKNRFGSTSEIGIYEMRQQGLRQVENPSELLLTDDHDGLSGVAISSAIEGVRPFLIETQALVSSAAYGTPQRSATGFDQRRLHMLLAVLEKRGGLKVSQCDAYLNIIGGLTLDEPAADLAAVVAIASSYLDKPVPNGMAAVGEVGLSGEIRSVSHMEQRLSEVKRLGFTQCIIPAHHAVDLRARSTLELLPVRNISEALRLLAQGK